MPELPEVETTKNSIEKDIIYQKVIAVKIHLFSLRYPIPKNITEKLQNCTIEKIKRRAKYILFFLPKNVLLIHLGMSGSLSIENIKSPLKKHDHVEIFLSNDIILRFHDPRRFGIFLLADRENYQQHFLLKNLGVEPLSKQFHWKFFFKICQSKKIAIKKILMDNHIVVGIGNIYASEILFLAKIHPLTQGNKIYPNKIKKIVKISKKVLNKAIQIGGTTLRDYKDGNGKIGYFQQKLFVYNREKQKCKKCKTKVEKVVLSQRSTFFCPECQK